jgi:hypothetical protein
MAINALPGAPLCRVHATDRRQMVFNKRSRRPNWRSGFFRIGSRGNRNNPGGNGVAKIALLGARMTITAIAEEKL